MRQQYLRLLWLNAWFAAGVPGVLFAAFDAPVPDPAAFALANLSAFRGNDFLSGRGAATWRVSAGGARLWGMPELQPFALRACGPLGGGEFQLQAYGLKSGAYGEYRAGAGYERLIGASIRAGADVVLSQVSIEDYGSAIAGQADARLQWDPQPVLSLAVKAVNMTGSTFGEGGYPLPQHLILGAAFSPQESVRLFVEVDQELRYDLSTRLGAVFHFLRSLAFLAGFQSQPNLIALGASAQVHSLRATAAFQYHSDLGLSQCYGIAVGF